MALLIPIHAVHHQSMTSTNPSSTAGVVPPSAGEDSSFTQQARDLALRLGSEVCGRPLDAELDLVSAFAGRLETCLHHQHAQSGDIDSASSVFVEVVLAEALLRHEPHAAERFERDYMPRIRGVARRTAGPRGEEMVDNFAAELILPRDSRPPRLAQYHGRVPLAHWLAVVASNHCISLLRAREAEALPPSDCLAATGHVDAAANADCSGLLGPLVSEAVGAVAEEDRLMVKLLLVDRVPQAQVAALLGVHTGNVGRRRQRIIGELWDTFRAAATKRGRAPRLAECIELMLAGQDRELARSLGGLLGDLLSTQPEGQA